MKSTAGLFVLASLAASLSFGDQLYATGFEASEGFAPGQLGGQQGWYNTSVPVVQDAVAYAGTQAASISAAGSGQILVAHDFLYDSIGNGDKLVTFATRFMYRNGAGNVTWNPLLAFSETAFLGQIFVRNGVAALGLGSSSVGSVALAPDTWHYIRFVFDFENRTKTAYANSTMIAALPFGAPGDGLRTVAFGQNSGTSGAGSAAFWDELTVTSAPEPAAIGLTMAGLGGVVLVGYRRRRR